MSALLDELLATTSRTFALTIPMLPEPLRREVGVAYLLLRVADTLEDANTWPRDVRVEALGRFAHLLDTARTDDVAADAARWAAAKPVENEHHVALVARLPEVWAVFEELEPRAQSIVRNHVGRATRGMAELLANTDVDGNHRLRTLTHLQGYCYVVAGIVGELLTELFLRDTRLAPAADALHSDEVAFGEGLQLVNILKDAADDAGEGRSFLPPTVDRAEVFALARADLARARRYVLALQRGGADRGIVAFTALPVLLARATLDAVERVGAGAKVGRDAVFRIVAEMNGALDAGEDAVAAGA